MNAPLAMFMQSELTRCCMKSFKQLNGVDRNLALETFEKNKDFYHPICKTQLEKDLGITK